MVDGMGEEQRGSRVGIGRVVFRLPLLAAKECPVCHARATYDPRESKAPAGWIHFQGFGADEIVCSEACVSQIIAHQKKWLQHMKESRLQLPEEVVLRSK